MKKYEEYFGTLKNGSTGIILFSSNDYKNLEEILNNQPVYGYCVTNSLGNTIFLDRSIKDYTEEELEINGYNRLVKINKITTTIEEETIL